MNNNTNSKIAYGVGGIIGGLLLASMFTSTMFSGFNGGMMGNNSQNTGNNQMMGNIDKHFIEQMIPHHEGAIAMAELALERSKKPEILTLAKNIIKAQEGEITDMKQWYQEWFGKEVPVTSQGGGMMGGNSLVHMGSVSGDIDVLKNAKEFDQEFVRQMIPHHEMAIMMAQMLQSGTNRSEMKQLAENIIKSQSEEIQKMRSWSTE